MGYRPTNANGQATMANSSPVVIASNQTAVPASQSGTWTVQPGNTANTTAWKVDGSAVTQPVSIAATVATDPTDDATRDNGKIDVASLDQYTPVSGRLAVDGSGVTQPVSFTNSGDVATQTTLAAVNAKLVSGTDIGDVTINNSTGASAVNIQDGGNSITVDGTITANLAAGNNNIGDVDVASIAAGTNLVGDVDIAPRTTGGWSVGNFTSGDTWTALTNTAQVVKGSAGKFGGYYIYNPNTFAAYVMVYNVAAASVTVGTTTAKLIFCIPASGGANLEILAGIPFDTAISCAAATTASGNTAPTTALEAMIWYK